MFSWLDISLRSAARAGHGCVAAGRDLLVFGIGSGTVSVIARLANHSLTCWRAGLGMLADVTGSATLTWRFQGRAGQPGRSQAAEVRADWAAALMVAAIATGQTGTPHRQPPV